MDAAMQALEPFVGEWRIALPGAAGEGAAPHRAKEGAGGEAITTFESTLGGAFLLQRATIPVEGAPDALCMIAPAAEGEGWTQHYFDSRGVVRLYAMRFDGRDWTLERRSEDFSPLRFHQRWHGRFSDDGATIEGAWEIAHDMETFELDFPLIYRRVG